MKLMHASGNAQKTRFSKNRTYQHYQSIVPYIAHNNELVCLNNFSMKTITGRKLLATRMEHCRGKLKFYIITHRHSTMQGRAQQYCTLCSPVSAYAIRASQIQISICINIAKANIIIQNNSSSYRTLQDSPTTKRKVHKVNCDQCTLHFTSFHALIS